MNLFNVNQLTTNSRVVAGFEELQPDSWSVKVSLLHVRPEERTRFLTALRGVVNSCLPRYPEQLRARIVKYASDAAEARSSTEAHKYVLLNEPGIFSGPFAPELPALTSSALRRAFDALPDRAQHVVSVARLDMCIFVESEYDLYAEAFAEETRRAQEFTDSLDLGRTPTQPWQTGR